MKIFYAMSFTGKTYEQIVAEREKIGKVIKKMNCELIEQFIGIEEKQMFESHGYQPEFIVEKDKRMIRIADLIIVDFSAPSIGRDCELIIAKEIYNKPIIAIVPDKMQKKHPWIRYYSDHVVLTQNQAFELIKNYE